MTLRGDERLQKSVANYERDGCSWQFRFGNEVARRPTRRTGLRHFSADAGISSG